MNFIIRSFFLLCLAVSFSQENIEGIVLELSETEEPIIGANVFWLDTTVGTITDFDGKFILPYKSTYKQLVISYVGFKTDTIQVENPNIYIKHKLESSSTLEAVVIESEKQATLQSLRSTANMLVVNEKELLKAACCNLSESFETNPSIDVNFSDAITGTKQIKMLGLTNPYILIAQENIPNIRGASQAYGLTFTPGTWIESIQITKGMGSVVNGYESIAGQINTELQKPRTSDKFFLNTYGALQGRLELNTHYNTKVSNKWNTGLYVHGNYRGNKIDDNNDNFLDSPLMQQINIMNRWQYINTDTGWVSFIDFRYMNDEKQAGEVDFKPSEHKGTATKWGSEINTEKFDVSTKLGYVFKDIPYKSFGLQTAYSNHKQDSYYGLTSYGITHQSVYSSFLYNSIISNTKNKIKLGLSLAIDDYDENVAATIFDRKENGVGAFFEYTFDNLDNFSLVAGLRADTHNVLGEFITPRLHLRYNPWEKAALRASFGRGKRSASVFAENQQYFASNRAFVINSTGNGSYGLNPEIAWNYGFNFLQKFKMFDKKGSISVDFYNTIFEEQVVVDVDSNPQQVLVYNLDNTSGSSVASSFQTDFNYTLAKHLDLRLSYKYYDVVTDYQSGKLTKALNAKHRLFGNLSYQTHYSNDKGARWKFDTTWNWVGKKRIPFTGSNPLQYQLEEYSNPFSQLNFQVTKVFSKQFEIYLGGENITNYKQDNPIIGSDDPFGPYFDSTLIYAPINGANYFAGLRYKLN